MVNTSMVPETDGYPVCYKYVDNTFPVTLGNLFKKQGYRTYAYHNNYAEYYNRAFTFANYGYDFYDSYKLGLTNLEADSTLAEQIGWMLVENESFMAYWITYSGHQPYNLQEVGVSKESVQKVKDFYLGLNDDNVAYLAKQMDLDKALSHIFYDVMDWNNRIDDVVIVIIGDHPSKSIDYSKGSNFDNVIHKNSTDTPSEFYTPCFIYSTGIEHIETDKYMTALDLIPTLANMWDINYDKSKVFGDDIVDEDYDGLSFDVDGNCFNKHFKYDSTTEEITTYNGYSKTEAQNLVNEFNKKREICNEVLRINYFGEKRTIFYNKCKERIC